MLNIQRERANEKKNHIKHDHCCRQRHHSPHQPIIIMWQQIVLLKFFLDLFSFFVLFVVNFICLFVGVVFFA